MFSYDNTIKQNKKQKKKKKKKKKKRKELAMHIVPLK